MRRLIIALGGLSLAVLATPCFASPVSLCGRSETVGILKTATVYAGDAADRSEASVAAAPAESSVSRASGIDITADADGGNASIRIGGSLDTAAECEGGYLKSRTGVWSVTVSAPLTSDKDAAEKRATLDGLAGSTSAEFNVRQLIVKARATIDVEELNAICREAFAQTDDGKTRPWSLATDECGEDLVEDWAPGLLPRYRNLAWGESASAVVWGASGKVGSEDFDYFDATTLAKMSDSRTGWSLKAYYAAKPLDEEKLFTFQYEHQSAWEGQEEKILCPAGGPTSACVKGAPGKPTKVEKDIVSFEYRQRTGNKAFALNLGYDANNGVAAIGLPIYLTTDDKGSFIGGIRFDWRSDTEEATAAIFIGTPLTFGLP